MDIYETETEEDILAEAKHHGKNVNLGKNVVDKEISRNGEFIDSKKESFSISYDKNKSGIEMRSRLNCSPMILSSNIQKATIPCPNG